ncbi:MAG: ankyrin repeat domain-containing protein [Bacteroidota bacterium]
MKLPYKYTMALFLMVALQLPGLSQTKNILIDRSFWKGQPTLEEVKQKVKEGHSPTEMTPFNFDAIGYAILENNSIETIKYLLDQGNDVNKLTHDARTYIFWAAYKGNLDLMKYLIEIGAKTDIIDQHGNSLFMFTAVTGQKDQAIFDYCIELGADVLKERDRIGRNALIAYAGSMKNFGMLDYFIEKGLDINSVDQDGNGVFHHAAKTGNIDFMKKLVSKYKVDIKKNEQTNENAILFASRRFSRTGEETGMEFYQYLEGLGLDPTITSNKGNTVVQNLAMRSKNIELFQYFINKGVDVNQKDEEGNNALMYASSRRNKEIVALLAEHTDDINAKNEEGISSFARALKYNSLEVAKFLQSKGANTNLVDNKGYNLGYHIVDAYRGNMEDFNERMAYLISLGYNPISLQKDGSTLLHGHQIF